MIHYSCDCCGRRLNAEKDLRYVVRIEVEAAMGEPDFDDEVDDRDALQELHQILEDKEDDAGDLIDADVYQRLRFDLCPDCRKRLVRNPLGREPAVPFKFSKN